MCTQNIADCFSNILSPDNNAAWMELNRVSLHYGVDGVVKMLIFIYFQTNVAQSQMLLMNLERFGLLLGENLEIGSNRMVVSENISKSFSQFLLCSE